MHVGELVARNARRYPDKVGLHYAGCNLTYRELNERVNRVANALADQGIRKGDRVAIMTRNCPEFVETYLAAGKMGAVTVPINYRLAPGEVEYIVSNAEASALLFEDEYAEVTEHARSKRHGMLNVCVGDAPSGFLSFANFAGRGAPDEPEEDVTEEDLSLIMYTSGTTGFPKGAMLTHRNVLANTVNMLLTDHSSEADKVLVACPLYHLAGFAPLMCHLYIGASSVLLHQFDPVDVLEAIQRERATYSLLVPAMINFCTQVPEIDSYDLSSMRIIAYGAAPIAVSVLKEGLAKFGCRFLQYYGLTESSPMLTRLLPEDHIPDGKPAEVERLKSAGKPIVNVDVRVVDEQDREVPVGVVGEIIARGANVMRGYWNMPGETARTMRGGWLHTGDLARVDEDGFIYIVDRANDAIISGGENIYPAEIERVIDNHPSVLESAAFGVPDERWGEAVMAAVVLKPGEIVAAEDIIAFCKENMASYKKPKYVEFIDALPRNASGKILKRVLREKYWRAQERMVQ